MIGNEQDSGTIYDENKNVMTKKEASAKEPLQKPSMWSDERGNLKFVNLVVRRPFTIFFIILATCIILSFLLGQIVFKAGNPFRDPANQFEIKDIRSIQLISLRLAAEDIKVDRDTLEAAGDGSVTMVQSRISDGTSWVFESEQPEGVFGTRASIGAMKDILDLFFKDPQFRKYCLLDYRMAKKTDSELECTPPLTALNMYYSNATWDSAGIQSIIAAMKEYPNRMELLSGRILCLRNLIDDCGVKGTEEELQWSMDLGSKLVQTMFKWDGKSGLVENITEATELAAYIMKVPVLKGAVDFSYDREFSVENPVSIFSRAVVLWGAPLNITTEDSVDAGAAVINRKNLTIEEIKKQTEEKKKADDKALKDYIVQNFLEDMKKAATDTTDPEINSYYLMFALLLDIFLQIAVKDALLVVFSLGFVFIWIRINVGSWFLAFIGLLEIFFSLPLAWFFFKVVFKIEYFAALNCLTIYIVAAIGADDIFIFMDAYKQSRTRDLDILVDLETRLSWVYRRTGTAMAITSATTCTAFLCTLITPLVNIRSFGIFAAFVILLDYILVMTLFCTSVVIYHNKFENQGCFRSMCCTQNGNPTEDARQALLQSGEAGVQGDRLSEFFKNNVAGFISNSVNRLILFVIFACWMGVAIYQITKLEPTKVVEQGLPNDHPLQKSINILEKEFPTADDDLGLLINYAWGLEEVDPTGINLLMDPDNFGKPKYVETFDYNEQCQTELLAVCEDFRTNKNYTELIKRKDGVGSTKCFIEELGAFYLKESGVYDGLDVDYCSWVKSGTWKSEEWQVPSSEIATIMPKFLQEQSCIDESKFISAYYETELGWDGENMRYAVIAVESNNLDPFFIKPEEYSRGQYNQFVDIQKALSDTNGKVGIACTGSVIMTDLTAIFVFMNKQSIYIRTAIQTALLGIAVAFFVLLLSTRSLHIAFFASVTIMCVLISVTGTMVLLGWSLGVVESVLIGIIAGFSVDYVVHLAHSYKAASGDTETRIRAAFGDMGISVLNGMITSVGASIPLFFCQLQFFKKFGTFLCMVIGFSWIFANFAFMSVLAQLKIPIQKKGKKASDDANAEDVLEFSINGGVAGTKNVVDDNVYEYNLPPPIKIEPKIYESTATTPTISKPPPTQEIVLNNDHCDSNGEESA